MTPGSLQNFSPPHAVTETLAHCRVVLRHHLGNQTFTNSEYLIKGPFCISSLYI